MVYIAQPCLSTLTHMLTEVDFIVTSQLKGLDLITKLAFQHILTYILINDNVNKNLWYVSIYYTFQYAYPSKTGLKVKSDLPISYYKN